MILLATGMLWLTGCQGLGSIQDPSAKVVSVRVTQHTDQGSRVEVQVDLSNPNTAPLPLKRCQYTLRIADAGVYSFDDYPQRTLPSHGAQSVVLPAGFPTDKALAGASYELEGSIQYEPPGEVRKLLTESKIPLPSVGFHASGRIQ